MLYRIRNGEARKVADIGGSGKERTQSDWLVFDQNNPAFIRNKPKIPAKLETLAESDWNANVNEPGYIHNKPAGDDRLMASNVVGIYKNMTVNQYADKQPNAWQGIKSDFSLEIDNGTYYIIDDSYEFIN